MNKEFYEDARKVAESCSKERLVELYLAEVQTCCELEEQLANAIVLPKYEKGQKFYYIRGNKVEEAYFQRFNNWITADVILNPHEVKDDDGYIDVDYDFDMVSPKQMFSTKEEAQAKLKEIQDE